jgi:hypothetical protein
MACQTDGTQPVEGNGKYQTRSNNSSRRSLWPYVKFFTLIQWAFPAPSTQIHRCGSRSRCQNFSILDCDAIGKDSASGFLGAPRRW